MKDEYVIKITETEAKAICHGFGRCHGFSGIVHEIYYSLLDSIYGGQTPFYKEDNKQIRCSMFTFTYEGHKK